MSRGITETIGEAAEKLPSLFTEWRAPAFFVQCGSGFEPERLFDSEPQPIEMRSLPGMLEHKTPDQEHPLLLYGMVNGIPVLATKGHRHLYEGCGTLPCILPLCVAHRLGVNAMVFMDGALSLNNDIKPGTWMLLTDFINAHSCSPLDGNHELLPDAFPDMTNALSQHLNSELVNALSSVGITPRLGVYMSRPGSQFCTVSEANTARANGADLVGHDLVMEIIMGHALGCHVSAFALATLMAPDYYSRRLTREAMLDACHYCSIDMMRGLRNGIREFVTA
ncbi:MAG: hypothetical protein J5833_00295 [Victivallales bacterium]|nr:hypothetical protein [Victivallales bacterium]